MIGRAALCSSVPWLRLAELHSVLQYLDYDWQSCTVLQYLDYDWPSCTLFFSTLIMIGRAALCSSVPWLWLAELHSVLQYLDYDWPSCTLFFSTLIMIGRAALCSSVPWLRLAELHSVLQYLDYDWQSCTVLQYLDYDWPSCTLFFSTLITIGRAALCSSVPWLRLAELHSVLQYLDYNWQSCTLFFSTLIMIGRAALCSSVPWLWLAELHCASVPWLRLAELHSVLQYLDYDWPSCTLFFSTLITIGRAALCSSVPWLRLAELHSVLQYLDYDWPSCTLFFSTLIMIRTHTRHIKHLIIELNMTCFHGKYLLQFLMEPAVSLVDGGTMIHARTEEKINMCRLFQRFTLNYLCLLKIK